jgi:hypothetical protein
VRTVGTGSATTCIAAGNFLNFPGGVAVLALAWRHGSWQRQQTPSVPGAFTSLNAMFCRSRQACAAVGGSHNGTGLALPLAEGWNGTAWALQAAQPPRGGGGSVLAGVAPARPRGTPPWAATSAAPR